MLPSSGLWSWAAALHQNHRAWWEAGKKARYSLSWRCFFYLFFFNFFKYLKLPRSICERTGSSLGWCMRLEQVTPAFLDFYCEIPKISSALPGLGFAPVLRWLCSSADMSAKFLPCTAKVNLQPGAREFISPVPGTMAEISSSDCVLNQSALGIGWWLYLLCCLGTLW